MRQTVLSRSPLALAVLLGCALVPATASAQQTLRFAREMRGGVQVIGTSMGWDCGSSVAAPAGADCSGAVLFPGDTSPDILWVDGAASIANTAAQARTAATLVLPAGSSVVLARLYWAGRRAGTADDQVTLEGPVGGEKAVTADQTWTSDVGIGDKLYQGTADVTAIVQAGGAGAYRLSDLDVAVPLLDEDLAFGAWTLVVAYHDPGGKYASLSVYDGFDKVAGVDVPSSLSIAAPASPVHPATLAVVAYDGDFETSADAVSWNGTELTNALNQSLNFFNSSRTNLGVAVASDLPALSGAPDTMAGYDLDVVDISSLVASGTTAATFNVSTLASETVFLGALVPEIRGCQASTDCVAPTPVCNVDSGDCSTSCTTDADCTGTPAQPHCNPTSMTCVECVQDSDCMAPKPFCDEEITKCVKDDPVSSGAGGAGGGSSAGGASAAGGASSAGGASAAGGAPSGANAVGVGGAAEPDFAGLAAEGGGCGCSIPGNDGTRGLLAAGTLAAVAALAAALRRRPRRS